MGYWTCDEYPNEILRTPEDIVTEILGDSIDEYVKENLESYITETYGDEHAYTVLMDRAGWIEEQLEEFEEYWDEVSEETIEKITEGEDIRLFGLMFRWHDDERSFSLKPRKGIWKPSRPRKPFFSKRK